MKYTVEYEPNNMLIDGINYCFLLRIYLSEICIFIGRYTTLEECTSKVKEVFPMLNV